MDHKERFYATIERRPVDRPCSWLGIPDAQVLPGLFDYFGANSIAELQVILDDDIVPVELPYHSPDADAIYAALDFAKQGKIDREHRTLNAGGLFEDRDEPAAVDDFAWPDPAEFIAPAQCAAEVAEVDDDRVVLGVLWSAHFQDVCAAFGLQTAFMKFQ